MHFSKLSRISFDLNFAFIAILIKSPYFLSRPFCNRRTGRAERPTDRGRQGRVGVLIEGIRKRKYRSAAARARGVYCVWCFGRLAAPLSLSLFRNRRGAAAPLFCAKGLDMDKECKAQSAEQRYITDRARNPAVWCFVTSALYKKFCAATNCT